MPIPPVRMNRGVRPLAIGLALAIPLALAACGSSSGPSSAASASPTGSSASAGPASSPASASPSGSSPASAEATSGASAIAAIKANWATFFNAKTPTAQRVDLLQNGSTFASVISAQAGGGLASTASASVKSVSLTSQSQATVVYDILIGGSPALTGQKGVAVYQDGIWKVGDASFCGLLALENGGKTSGLPAACQG